MPQKMFSIEEVHPNFHNMSVASLLLPADRRLALICNKLMQADVQTVSELSSLGAAGLRKKYGASEKIVKRVRQCFWNFGVKFP